jgi:hypothetical protein
MFEIMHILTWTKLKVFRPRHLHITESSWTELYISL